MQLNGWERALKVTADGTGPVGHAGAVLLRKAADQAGPDRLAGPGRCGRRGNRPFSTGGSSSLSPLLAFRTLSGTRRRSGTRNCLR